MEETELVSAPHSACSLPSRTMQPSQASSTVNCLRRHGRPPQDASSLSVATLAIPDN